MQCAQLSSSILCLKQKLREEEQVAALGLVLWLFYSVFSLLRNAIGAAKAPPVSAALGRGSGRSAMVEVVTGPGRLLAAAFQGTFFFKRQKQSKHGKYFEMGNR